MLLDLRNFGCIKITTSAGIVIILDLEVFLLAEIYGFYVRIVMPKESVKSRIHFDLLEE